jgi:hypothetical protein
MASTTAIFKQLSKKKIRKLTGVVRFLLDAVFRSCIRPYFILQDTLGVNEDRKGDTSRAKERL